MDPPRFPFPRPALDGVRERTWSTPPEGMPGGVCSQLGEVQAWKVILAVGGLCWLVVTSTTLWWMWPQSGTTLHGVYYVSNGARATEHLIMFIAAACAYRIAVALGWPQKVWARARVVLVNIVLALSVVALSPAALAFAGGFIDAHVRQMQGVAGTWSAYALWHFWAMPLRFFLPPYVLGLCAIALVLLAHRHQSDALRASELARAYTAARMAMLSAQLQPHFLFNSLHAISVLIDDSPHEAATMIARLGDFLRHALESSRWPWVDVATELAGLEAYLAVQQTRFSDRLSIAIDASRESLGIYVPSLLLQPLAENAIEHGRNEGGPALHVRVCATVIAERLCIVVNNSSPQLSADLAPCDYGHGLSNVDLRLRAAYGGEAHLRVGPDQQGGTTAFLDLPVRRCAGAAARLEAVPS